MLTTFMVVLDSTVVNVALPHIAGSMSASVEEATWTLTSFLVAMAIVLPATGWLGSLLGRKRLLLACVVVFTLASVACGAAQSLGFLIVARVIQGLGGGAMQPISQAVLLESFPPKKRGVAMAVFGLGVVVAPIIGPTLGGWITDNYSWRWIFYINIPIGLMAVSLIKAFLEDPPYIRTARPGRLDLFGLVVLAIWVGSLHVALDKGQQEDWLSSPLIGALLAMAAVGFIVFIFWEWHARHPVVDLHILRDRNFSVGTGLITVVGAVLYGSTALLPLFLQTLLGYTALKSGLTVSPRGVGSLVAMFMVGRLIGLIDGRALLVGGFIALAYSTYALGNLDLQIAPSSVVWPNILTGLSLGFIFVPLTTSAMGMLRNEQMANATGIYNLMRNIGGAVGIALMTTMLARGGQVHQTIMVAHATPYNAPYQQQLQAIQSGLAPISGNYLAAQQAYGVLYGQVGRQATLWAFVDNFRLLAAMTVLCMPALLLLRRLRHEKHATQPAITD
jgi:DHA2 family multidrug resistance protein